MAGMFNPGMMGAMGMAAQKRNQFQQPQQPQSGIAPTQQFGGFQGLQGGAGGGGNLNQMNGFLQSGEAFGQPQIGAPGSGMGMASMMPTNIADLIRKFSQGIPGQGTNPGVGFGNGFGGGQMGRMMF